MAALSEGTSRMPSTPSAMQDSIAATWPSLSPSSRPASAVSFTPSSSAFACAPSRILTKNGLVSVLVIRQADTSCAKAGPAASATVAAAARSAPLSVPEFIRYSSRFFFAGATFRAGR